MTIFALSTGPGISGIAIIRVSGEDTKKVIKLLTNTTVPEPRIATLRKINKINTSELIDDYFHFLLSNHNIDYNLNIVNTLRLSNLHHVLPLMINMNYWKRCFFFHSAVLDDIVVLSRLNKSNQMCWKGLRHRIHHGIMFFVKHYDNVFVAENN